METYADCLRRLAIDLDWEVCDKGLIVAAELIRIASGLRHCGDEDKDEAEQQVSPPLMVIENRPKLGVSAKYEMPALKALSRTEFETFVTRVCGSVSQIAAARAAC